MSDSEMNDSSMSISGGRRTRICGFCGKSEKEHWKRHWMSKHPTLIAFEKGQPDPNTMQVVPYGRNHLQQDRQSHRQVIRSHDVDAFFERRPPLAGIWAEQAGSMKR